MTGSRIEGLTELECLQIGGTQIRGSGLKHVRNLVRLQALQLEGLAVADGDLVHLRNLTALEWLHLGGTRVSGPGLANLRAMSQLRYLDLRAYPITDKRSVARRVQFEGRFSRFARRCVDGRSIASKFHQIPDALWERIDLVLPIYNRSCKGGGRGCPCGTS